jgi:hypothetical protein
MEGDEEVERQRESSGQAFMAGTGLTLGGGESVRRGGTTMLGTVMEEVDGLPRSYVGVIMVPRVGCQGGGG